MKHCDICGHEVPQEPKGRVFSRDQLTTLDITYYDWSFQCLLDGYFCDTCWDKLRSSRLERFKYLNVYVSRIIEELISEGGK